MVSSRNIDERDDSRATEEEERDKAGEARGKGK